MQISVTLSGMSIETSFLQALKVYDGIFDKPDGKLTVFNWSQFANNRRTGIY